MFGNRRHQVAFVVDRQFDDIGKAVNIARFDPLSAPQAPIERQLPTALHELAKLPILQAEQFIPAHGAIPIQKRSADRIILEHLRRIEGFEIGRIGHRGSTK